MKTVPVITCFLTNRDGKLLILRRSSQVGTYRGQWSGVSGYLELTPVEQAYRELSEEVGLSPQDVTLLARGDPLEVVDPHLDRRWVVHPFLFRAESPEKVRLDWESIEARWVDLGELASYPTVPGLLEALVRVLGHHD